MRLNCGLWMDGLRCAARATAKPLRDDASHAVARMVPWRPHPAAHGRLIGKRAVDDAAASSPTRLNNISIHRIPKAAKLANANNIAIALLGCATLACTCDLTYNQDAAAAGLRPVYVGGMLNGYPTFVAWCWRIMRSLRPYYGLANILTYGLEECKGVFARTEEAHSSTPKHTQAHPSAPKLLKLELTTLAAFVTAAALSVCDAAAAPGIKSAEFAVGGQHPPQNHVCNIKADVRRYKQAAAQTTSGNIAFSGSGSGNEASLSLSATNGDIKADASGCGNVDLGTASGRVTLTGDTSPSAELRVTAKSGDATVDVTGWTSLTSETGSGDIRITGGPSGGTTSAKTGSGNVTMALRGDERDFSYQISAGSGSVRVGGRRMGDSAQYTNSDTRNMIHANTRSGNIRVDFTQN